MDGLSLIDAMETGRTEGRLAYADSVNMLRYGRGDTKARSDVKDDKLYCLMSETHKLIFHQLRPENTEFYDLAADPAESNNLAGTRPPAMRDLLKRLGEYNAFSPLMPGMTQTDLERLKKLESLGYNR